MSLLGAHGSMMSVSGSATGYDAEVLADSPLVYFKLDEAAGGDLSTIADSSGNGRNAIIDFSSATADVSNVSMAAVSGLAGIGRYMKFDNALTGGGTVSVYRTGPTTPLRMTSGAMTFEFWWIRQTTPRWMIFNGAGNGGTTCYYEIRTGSSGTTFELKGSGGNVNFTITHGISDTTSFHHVVLIINSARSSCSLYVDGAFVSTASVFNSYAQAGTTESLYLGIRPDQAARTTLNNIAIYNSALSAARISAHYAARNVP